MAQTNRTSCGAGRRNFFVLTQEDVSPQGVGRHVLACHKSLPSCDKKPRPLSREENNKPKKHILRPQAA